MQRVGYSKKQIFRARSRNSFAGQSCTSCLFPIKINCRCWARCSICLFAQTRQTHSLAINQIYAGIKAKQINMERSLQREALVHSLRYLRLLRTPSTPLSRWEIISICDPPLLWKLMRTLISATKSVRFNIKCNCRYIFLRPQYEKKIE